MTIRRRRPATLDVAELERRSRWAAILSPELTDREQEALREHRKDSWVPGAALGVLWDCYDVHNGDPWALAAFTTALGEDASQIDRMLERYPDQRQRLVDWLRKVEALAVECESNSGGREMGEVYQELSTLGYQSGAMNVNAGKENGESDAT